MYFMPRLADLVLAGKKPVTRRLANDNPRSPWFRERCSLVPGRDYAVSPGRGKPALGRVVVTSTHRERLGRLDEAEARREGFASVAEFEAAFAALNGGAYNPDVEVWRVELAPVTAKPFVRGATVRAIGFELMSWAGLTISFPHGDLRFAVSGEPGIRFICQQGQVIRRSSLADLQRWLLSLSGVIPADRFGADRGLAYVPLRMPDAEDEGAPRWRLPHGFWLVEQDDHGVSFWWDAGSDGHYLDLPLTVADGWELVIALVSRHAWSASPAAAPAA